MGFTGTPAAERTEVEIRRRFAGMFLSIGQYNRRKISGSTTWSQHSWGNALDIMVGGTLNTGTPEGLRNGDIMYAWLVANKKALGIRYILWRRKNHYNHIHVDFWPKGYATPPVSSTGIGSFQYSNGTKTSTRIQLVPPEGDWVYEPIEEEIVLKRGDEGNSVKLYQRCLNEWLDEPIEVDGVYGQGTEEAVTSYQKAADLGATGMIDGVTAANLIRYSIEPGGTVDQVARDSAASATNLAKTNQSKLSKMKAVL